jgi:hypothetical protein
MMKNWMDMIKDDVNQDDGAIITIFTNFTTLLFKGIIFLAIPLFLYASFVIIH